MTTVMELPIILHPTATGGGLTAFPEVASDLKALRGAIARHIAAQNKTTPSLEAVDAAVGEVFQGFDAAYKSVREEGIDLPCVYRLHLDGMIVAVGIQHDLDTERRSRITLQ